MPKKRIVVLVVSISLLVTGCVGAGPITTGTITQTVPIQTLGLPSAKFRFKVCPHPREIGELSYCKAAEAQSFTMERVLSMWGQPKSRGIKDGQEYLTYNRSVAWRGLMVFIIIPIPLLFPIGHNQTTLFFEHNQLTRTTFEYGKSNIALCGYHSTGPNGFGCRTGW